MKQKSFVSLKTKILTLIIGLILGIVLLLTTIYIYNEIQDERDKVEKLSLQVVKTLSFLPPIQHAFENSPEDAKIILQQMRAQVGADALRITSKEGKSYSYPTRGSTISNVYDSINYKALTFGGYYLKEGKGVNGPSYIAKAPIIQENEDSERIIGVVTAEFSKKSIYKEIWNKLHVVLFSSLVVVLLGIWGGILLTKSIRKDTLGLEPAEISSLYRERQAVIQSIKEGIVSIDREGYITTFNQSAKELLGLEEADSGQLLEHIYPQIGMKDVLMTGESKSNEECLINDKLLIVNVTPIMRKEKIIGGVASFRDKTELKKLVDKLSEVKKYSEDLRAQTHEFANKLHLLLGLLQLGYYDEAIAFIEEEYGFQKSQNDALFQKIVDHKVQGMLLGKIGKASEKKIHFTIDENSSLHQIPEHIETSGLTVIIGNLIDNAFEAVRSMDREKKVSFFITDLGQDIIIEVEDNGEGISDEQISVIFQSAFSTKGKDRGYGLTNVKRAVAHLHGEIEVQSEKGKRTIFTVYLPKEIKGV